jgi:RNA-directed DNA polymerase
MFARFWRWLRGLLGGAPKALPRPATSQTVAPSATPRPQTPKKSLIERVLGPPVPPTHQPTRRERTAGFRARGAVRWETDTEKLDGLGLPLWTSEAELADAVGVSQRQLRYFATHRPMDRVAHYVHFAVPKARGGERILSAPKTRLKAVQRQLVERLVRILPVAEAAHGFRQGRSVASNAAPHVGKAMVVRLDLADFFGTVTFPRVRGLLRSYGYGHSVASSLALLMTEAHRQPVDVDGVLHYAAVGPRHCVQGAPTSPGICNALVRRMDHRLGGLARGLGFDYTRYADDLVFSGDAAEGLSKLLGGVRNIVSDEGFALNDDKTRIMRAGGHQHVTGVTVNEVMGLSRKERRKIRAGLHKLDQQRAQGIVDPVLAAHLQGKLAWLQMLNPAQAEALRAGRSTL